jgi:hypothetical protein
VIPPFCACDIFGKDNKVRTCLVLHLTRAKFEKICSVYKQTRTTFYITFYN